MEKRQVLGVLSSLMLLGGVFAPAVTLGLPPDMKWFSLQSSISYFQYTSTYGHNEWFVVVGLAGFGLVLAILKMCLGLLFTSITSGGIVLFTVIDFQQRGSLFLKAIPESIAGHIVQWTGILSGIFIQFSWGSVLLVAGPALMLVAALLPRERRLRSSRGRGRLDRAVVCSRCRGLNDLRHTFCAHCAAPLLVSFPAGSYQSTPGGQVPFLPQPSHKPPPLD